MGRPPFAGQKTSGIDLMLWADDAACKDTPIGLWFPDPGFFADGDALRMCRRCPVMMKCREYAINNGLDDGVWGGLTADQRKTYSKRSKAKR
jgi:WhiB family redox-sensing transcriptional regulator